MENQKNNLSLWGQVETTDTAFTKSILDRDGNKIQTAINGTYMVREATRVFGPFGINWGVEIEEERQDSGAPLLIKVKDNNGVDRMEMIRDGSGNVMCEIHHTVKIRLWYQYEGKRGQVIAYGCTPYITCNQWGIKSDGEAPKKSLTDATKKALSQLGLSADVFMGLHDDIGYISERKAEEQIEGESKKDLERAKLLSDLIEETQKVISQIHESTTAAMVNGLAQSMLKRIDPRLNPVNQSSEPELFTKLERLKKVLVKASTDKKAAIAKADVSSETRKVAQAKPEEAAKEPEAEAKPETTKRAPRGRASKKEGDK